MERVATLARSLLPHQHHRAIGTVEKTPAHIARVRAAQKREMAKSRGVGRSTKWPTFRKKLLAAHRAKGRGCEACGSKIGLQLHHIKPFHAFPQLELEPSNIIVLCEAVGGLECHARIGHGGDFGHFNPRVRADAAALMADPKSLKAIVKRAFEARVVNAPT